MVSVGVTVCGVTAKFKKLRVSVKHSGQDLVRIRSELSQALRALAPCLTELPWRGVSQGWRRNAGPSGEDSVAVPLWPSPTAYRF